MSVVNLSVGVTRHGDGEGGLVDGQLAVFGNREGGVDVVVVVAELFSIEFHHIGAGVGAGGGGVAAVCHFGGGEQTAFAGGGVAAHGVFLTVVGGGADITCNGNVNLGLGDSQLAVFGNREGGIDVVILVAEHVGGESHWIFADNGAGGFVFAFEHNIFFIEQAAFAGEFVAGHALGLSVVNLLFGVTRHCDGDFGLVDGQRAAAEGICVVGVGGLHIHGEGAGIGDAGYSVVAPLILLGSSVPDGGSFSH